MDWGLRLNILKAEKTDFKSITKNYNKKAIKFEILILKHKKMKQAENGSIIAPPKVLGYKTPNEVFQELKKIS